MAAERIKRIILPSRPERICLLENSSIYQAALLPNLQVYGLPVEHFWSWYDFDEFDGQHLRTIPNVNPAPIIISDIFGMKWPKSEGTEVESAVIALHGRQISLQQAGISLSLVIFHTTQPEGLEDAINLIPNGLLIPKGDNRLRKLLQLAVDTSQQRPQILPHPTLMDMLLEK